MSHWVECCKQLMLVLPDCPIQHDCTSNCTKNTHSTHILPCTLIQLSRGASSCAPRSTGSKRSAFALAETLGAIAALQQICQDAATAAVTGPGSYQAKAPTQDILQVLCEQSITVAGRKAVAVAISSVPGALHRLMLLMHVSHQALFITGPCSLAAFGNTS